MPSTLTLKHNGESTEDPVEVRIQRRRMWRLIISVALLVVLLGIMGGCTTHFIPSDSMLPTLKPGDHILTARAWLAYPAGLMPSRGDIIIFHLPNRQSDANPSASDAGNANAGPPSSPQQKHADDKGQKEDTLIKRVIGVPGDTVQIVENVVIINGQKYAEDYATIPSENPDDTAFKYAVHAPLVVPTGEVFVLGDNRNNSDDGRFWGTLKRHEIIGRFVRVLYNEGENGLNETRNK
jgi:signal peptidase I